MMCPANKRILEKKDLSRLIGPVMILFGRIVLVTVFFFLGTFIAFGIPTTVTPAQLSAFLIIGLGLGLGGFRVSSGTWSGSLQVLHWTAAISGLLFLAAALRLFLFSNNGNFYVDPNRLGPVITVSAASLVSWLIRERAPKRRRRNNADRAQPGTHVAGHGENQDADSDDSITKEVFSEGYLKRARVRAQRRKSPWNLLLIPAVVIPFGGLWWSGVMAAELLHLRLYPGQHLLKSQGLGPVLAAISPFFGALPLAMIIGNLLVRLIPPVRRVLDEETRLFPFTKYRNGQKQLFKIALVLVPLSFLFLVIGALLEWHW